MHLFVDVIQLDAVIQFDDSVQVDDATQLDHRVSAASGRLRAAHAPFTAQGHDTWRFGLVCSIEALH